MESPGGIILAGETEELRDKPAAVLIFPPQIPQKLTRARNLKIF
jgi:hypothetical protein